MTRGEAASAGERAREREGERRAAVNESTFVPRVVGALSQLVTRGLSVRDMCEVAFVERRRAAEQSSSSRKGKGKGKGADRDARPARSRPRSSARERATCEWSLS